jgi:very-short-patch-repair endonuclease
MADRHVVITGGRQLLLRARSGAIRPGVLRPLGCAARGPPGRTRRQSAPRAAEGPTACCTVRVTEAAFFGSGLLLLLVMREGARDVPAQSIRLVVRRGAGTPPAPFGGMTRSNSKPLVRQSAARVALLEERARGMRWAPTPSEQLLWARLRGRRLGVVFRRQVPLGGRFIADFLAPAERLVLEVDGAYHAERVRADARRDAELARAGYRVLRFEAVLVMREIETVLTRIRAAL